MEDKKREIIARVASGALHPEDAARELEELERAGGVATAEAAEPAQPVRTVNVSIALGQVFVIGDASVREAVADGPHTARREGDQLVVEGDLMNSSGFTFGNSRGWFMGGRPWKDAVTIRMNPALALEVDVQGGKASIRGVKGPIKAAVHAGAIDLVGFEAPIDLTTEAGAVTARGRLDGGKSRIQCAAGSVSLRLEHGSSLTVSARSDLGKVKLDGDGWRTAPAAAGGREVAVMGSGAGTLDVEVNVGAVKLTAS